MRSNKIILVDDDTYTNAVVLNWTKEKILTPSNANIALVMEPVEIRKICDRETLKPERYQSVDRIYSPSQDDKTIFGSKHRFFPSQILLFANICQDSEPFPSIKRRRMSIVCSFKRLVPLQVKRVAVIEKLLSTSLQIDFYGRDFRKSRDPRIKGNLPLVEKHKALRPYQFSIALENTMCPEVLTEKFQDCIVNHTVPITNNPGAKKYFPNDSCVLIDFNLSLDEIVNQIKQIYFHQQAKLYDIGLMQAKRQILYGNFSFAQNMLRALNSQI